MKKAKEENSGLDYLLDLKKSNDTVTQWLGVVLDQVDYTSGACQMNEMVGAILDHDVILNARKALKESYELSLRLSKTRPSR